jgi:amino acid adenylation domain-containing protein
MQRADDTRHADEPPAEFEFPLSPEQARLLVLDRMYPGSTQYHMPVTFAVRGQFDIPAFTGALDALVARHESLRTVFRAHEGDFVQVVAAEARVDVRVARGTPASDVHAALLEDMLIPFDLEHGPLLRCVLHAVDDGSHCILIVLHHIVCDGWSLEIMLREISASYRAALLGAVETPDPLPIQYPDYAVWQRDRLDSGEYADAIAYWRDQLQGVPILFPLPTDRPRPAVQSTAAGTVRLVIPADTRKRLAVVAQDHKTTAFTALFAAFNVFLYRISGQDDLVVGMPVSGRDHPDLQGMAGLLTNTLAMRISLSGDPTFDDLLDRVHGRLNEAQPYQDAPFGAVVDAVAPARELSYDPVVQVVFSYSADTELGLGLQGTDVEPIDLQWESAKFDLLLHVENQGDDLVALFIHRTDLLADGTVQHWARAFQKLLDSLLEQPDRPITTVDLAPAEDRELMLRDWNRTAAAVPDRLAPDLIADRAADHPDAIAVVCGEITLTYRDLIDRADRLAARLRKAGVGPDVPVALCLPRSAAMAVAALAVLRAGGAYVPLDPGNPPSRLAFMLANSGARLLIAAPGTADRTAGLGVPTLIVDDTAAGVVAEQDVPEDASDVLGVLDVPSGSPTRPGPDNLAYILYTSGSTGTPKGVAVEHRALANLASAVRRQFRITAEDRVLQFVSFGFDVAVSDLFFSWVAGAQLHIAGEDERLGDELYARLRDSRISYAFLPPAAAMSLPCPADALPDLRILAVGGEACPPELVQRWATPSRQVLDAYGWSEATVYQTTADLQPGRPVQIGHPVANSQVYLLDERLRPVPVGVTGEIYGAGLGLARGYAGRPGTTAERFVANPFGPPGSRMYRAGDLGRYTADGSLAFLGRVDRQVKIRGFRVELGEIETVMAGHPQIEVAAAAVLGKEGDRRLAGYLVPLDGAGPDDQELRGWLGARLPGYMVPEVFVRLDALPVNRSGKVERSRLPEPSATRPELGQRYLAPATDNERRVAEIWMRVLGLDRVGVHDNFFDLGGNSVRLLSVLAALREPGSPYGDVTLVDLFRHPTVATLAAHLDGPAAAARTATIPAVATEQADSRQRGQDRRERLTALRSRAQTNDTPVKGSTS